MLVARRPWTLELYRLVGKDFELIGESEPSADSPLLSGEVLNLGFRLIPGDPRPQIEVSKVEGNLRWLA
jgi:hypothetical protein